MPTVKFYNDNESTMKRSFYALHASANMSLEVINFFVSLTHLKIWSSNNHTVSIFWIFKLVLDSFCETVVDSVFIELI